MQAARRSLDIADVQYREGLVDFQRVLDSQRALFSQQERLVATKGGVAQSLIALYKAMGGGWQAGPLAAGRRRRRLARTMAERSNWKAAARRSAPAGRPRTPNRTAQTDTP